jgi:hypothetical protein
MEKRMHRHSPGDDFTPDTMFESLLEDGNFKPSPGSQIYKFDNHEVYKRFDRSDIIIILGVFLAGFFLAFTVTNYYRVRGRSLNRSTRNSKV